MDNEQNKNMENDPANPDIEASRKSDSELDTSSEPPQSQKPGAILAARRIAAGISEEQIASRLKMSLRQIRSLETDNYEIFHDLATARGFVRAYARVLQLDPEPLVATFSVRTKTNSTVNTSQGKPAEPFMKKREPFRKKRGTSTKIAVLLIIVIGALVIASNMKFFSFMEMFKKEKLEKAAPKVAPVSSVTPAAEVKETAPLTDPVQSAENKTMDQTAATVSSQTNDTGPATPANAPAQTPAMSNTPVKAEQALAAKGSLLVINFREKSWLQVQKKDGAVITEYIGKPGERRQLDVTEPVTVIVGFAPGVTMEYKGVPVDLASSTSNSVAKVTLK